MFLVYSTSVYFRKPNITDYEFPSEGFTTCTHTTSLTFDLTSDQGKKKNSQEIEKKLFTGQKSGEPFRRATEEDPSPGWTEQ